MASSSQNKIKKVDSSDNNSSSSNNDKTSTSVSTSTPESSKKMPVQQYIPSEVDLKIESIEKELLIYAPKIREPQKECIGCFNLFQFLYQQPPVAFYAVEED